MSILLKPPFTRQQINDMHARDYDFVCKKWPEAVRLALNPPPASIPAPPLFPRSDMKKIALAETVAAEYVEYAKKEGYIRNGVIADFAYDEFLKSKQEAQQLKNAEAECQRWADEHETYEVSESNRTAMWKWLQENDQSLTYANLDKAFATLVQSGDIKALLPVADRPEPRAGTWRNSVFIPFDTENSQGMIKTGVTGGLGQLDPSKVAAGEKQVTKSVRQQSAAEFLANINSSPTFRKKMDAA
jgi:hypothetical protein